MSGETTVRVGVLSLHNSKETKAILNAVEALGHEPVWLRRENTSVEIRDGELVLEPDVDVIANRLLLSKTEYPDELLGLVNMFASIVPTLNRPMSVLRATHKFAAAVRLAEEGIRVPDAILALSTERLNELCEPYGSEAVYKTAIGTHGGGTWKVDLNAPISSRVGKRQAFVQQLIEQGEDGPHSDLRVYVVGDSVIGGMIRSAPEEEWRTNVALGGDVSAAGDVLTDEVARIALDAADAIGLDYAGVDLIRNEEDWYVLEVNPTAGFKGFFEATGHSPAPHIARAAIETAGGSVDEDRVVDLTATLDDAVPSCKPTTGRRELSEQPTIGYTTEVVVSGTTGSATVVAKSDTGASRTSIDTGIAADVGAGPIRRTSRIRSGSSKSSRTRPVVDIVVGIAGNHYTVSANIEDRSHMENPVLLGRDILEHYQVDISKRVGEEDTTIEE
ncbi:RimK family alpha-L-glutamate ligase [Haladaptatus sp. DYF46]|uniref:RimK family alpha-L-glutamate ligase n=1 Tax=Haladaptatus sp. DYF46 TaxID=2886041 RepID=UPI001E55AC25|nr:RimK family alpha-L-glutamate ligase [Haladaptatus sp. DYF46]